MAEQLALLALPQVVTRTWADAHPGERLTYQIPGSEWCGTWTIRRIQPHPSSRNLLLVDLVDGNGRTWPTWANRRVPLPGCGFTLADRF